MTAHYRQRRISETILRYVPVELPNGRHAVRDRETGKLMGADYETVDLARAKCRMLAAADIERLYIGDRAAAKARIATILGEQSDRNWAAELIVDYFEGSKA